MKYIKKFNDEAQLDSYKKSNFVSPHIYLDSNSNTVKYMEEYQQLEYISSTSTGGQYIDLGCHLMENTDDIQIDIKFNIKGYGKDGNNNKQATLIASQPEVSPYPGFVLRKQTMGGDYKIELCTKWSFTNSTKQAAATRYDSMFLSYPQTDNSTTWVERNWNNIYEFTEILDNIPNSQVNNTTCTLFCALNGSNIPFRFCEADLYYLKFTKGGQVIRNLIPVKKVSTNEIGLYDMENDHLYVSQGDDPFEGGPIINN
jgi:hypothetical protein